jgi:hypothetical protein
MTTWTTIDNNNMSDAFLADEVMLELEKKRNNDTI